MRGYEGDEYENWDEYEEDGEEEQYEEEGGDDGYEEEPEQPTQEQLEYLELRQRLKDSFRKKMKKEHGATNAGSRDKTNTFQKDNYGSFFGPSQPVIAQRVIQESKSLLENPDLAARITKANHNNKRSTGSVPVSSKPRVNSLPTVTNGVKKKVEMLKNTRDYSFLLSEDAEVPPPLKNPPPRNVSVPKSDARPTQVLPKSKQVASDRGREVAHTHDARKQMVSSSQSRPKVGPDRSSGKLPVEPRKQLGSNNGSGPGRPIPPKGVPSKTSVPATRKVTPPVARNTMSGSQRLTPSSQHNTVRKPTSSQLQSSMHRRSPPRAQPSVLNKSSLVQKREYHEISKPKVVAKQPLPPSRDQQMRRPPPKPSARDERLKPKPKRRLDDGSDDENAINMIRQMFGYNPNRFRDDEDDSDMEANFDDIMREEKRSAKIARKEDEEQLRLIEEEERRERMRMAKKKQKLSR